MSSDPLPLTQPAPVAHFLHHFRLDRALASGGMGSVFLGFDTSLNRPVAIKVIRPELARDAAFVQRFVREAQSQAQVAHSNIVQVYFIGQAEGTVFIAMELVDGGALEQFITNKERLPWQDAVRHMSGLAEGLREAARLKIIHRDIKPANILLDRFGLAHLADFGLATAADASEPEPTGIATGALQGTGRLTQVGAIMGSPEYMSPEQASGRPLDFRADLFSLGATFYELVSGEVPLNARTIPEAQAFHATSRARPLRQSAPFVPKAFAEVIVDRCLEPDPARRFASYDELLSALAAAAPKPQVSATLVQRLLATAIDLALFASVARFTFQMLPWAGFAALAVWVLAGCRLLSATPGQWMMRLHLRTLEGAEPTFGASLLRFALQHSWLLFASLALRAVYRSEGQVLTFGFAGAALVLLLVGLTGLHNRLSKTRVLVDVG
jgi:serine/threonine protein kinase